MTWAERIERAEVVGRFSDDDNAAADLWETCAVGEKLGHRAVADNLSGELDTLGTDFSYAVLSDNVSDARRIFDQITAYKVE